MPQTTLPDSAVPQPTSVATPQSDNPDGMLEDILRSLWTNPMFRLSLSSNELFHSNTLQYFAEWISGDSTTQGSAVSGQESDGKTNESEADGKAKPAEPTAITKDAAMALFRLLNCDSQVPDWRFDSYSVVREWKNMDLVVFGSSQEKKKPQKHLLFALEIKVKSFPTNEQLYRYLAELHDHKAEAACTPACQEKAPLFLLTGMGASGIEANVRVVDFSTIADRLSESAGQQSNEPSLFFFRSYAQLCRDLHRLFMHLEGSLHGDPSWQEALSIGEQLTPFRLHPIWWKLWADHLKTQCTPHVDSSQTAYLHTYSDFTNSGVAGICWRWPEFDKNQKSGDALEIGVQIQGDSLRLFLSAKAEGLGSKSVARQNVENALIKLHAAGVFAEYPTGNYPHALKASNGLTASGRTSLPGIFVRDYHPSPRKAQSGIQYGLNGYANGENHGFADLRLQISKAATLSDVAEFVRDVMFNDRMSFPKPTANGADPILLQVVKGFESSKVRKSIWLGNPTF